MANWTSNDTPISIVNKWWTATTTNVSMTTAGTEYSFTIPTWTTKISFKLRDGAIACKLNIWTTPNLSWTTYITIPANCQREESGINTAEWLKLYFQSASNSQVAEIITWL